MMPCTGVADSAVRTACFSLQEIRQKDVLRERISRTVEELNDLRHYIGSVQHLVEGATGLLKSCEPTKPLDPDGILTEHLEEVEQFIEEGVGELGRWSDAGAETHHAVARACSSTVTALRRLHDATVRLRWAVLEHDANLAEVSSQSYAPSEINKLIADMES